MCVVGQRLEEDLRERLSRRVILGLLFESPWVTSHKLPPHDLSHAEHHGLAMPAGPHHGHVQAAGGRWGLRYGAWAFLRGLREGDRAVTGATANRYRDRISGMFTRAKRLCLVEHNPAHGIGKAKESAGRVAYLTADDEAAIRWADVDMLGGIITIERSKNGHSRRVPINSTVAALLVDLGAARTPYSDASELVFAGFAYRTVSRAFVAAVVRAQAALRDAGKDASRLEGYTWHGNWHTFASRLVMAGVDLLAVQILGGWRTAAMVQRYAHLAPDHLAWAVERLVSTPVAAVELRRSGDRRGVLVRAVLLT